MRLNNKLLLYLGLVWIIFLGISFYGAHQYLMKGFLKLEQNQINQNTVRVKQAIDQELYALGTFTTDWSHWNDAYDYIKGINPVFVPNNIDIIALVNSKVNLMIYLKSDGSIVIAMAVDLDNKKFIQLPQGIEKYIYPNSQLEKHKKVASFNTGLMSLSSGVMLVASAGVSNTDISDPINGTMIAGKYLSKEMLGRFSKNTNLQLTLFLPPEIDKKPGVKHVFDAMKRDKSNSAIRIINAKIAYGYLLLTDLDQMPIGMIQIDNPRVIFKTGADTIKFYLSIYLLSGIALVVVIWFLLRVLILNRLEYLNKEIRTISKEKNYAKRIELSKNDELTSLATQFNNMMTTIQSSHEQLEKQVDELSISEQILEKTNKQLTKEINERKLAEEKINVLHNKLILAARRAGMADIASGVLHNIGNILNSVETSVSMIREKAGKSKEAGLANLVNLLQEHENNIVDFLTKDEKGKKIIAYLLMLSQSWSEEKDYVISEVTELDKNISHIKNVVVMQQSLSSIIAMTEQIDLIELIHDALILNKTVYESARIEVSYDYAFTDRVEVDRVKLLHILVNLIKNSIDSLLLSQNEPKLLKISTQKNGDDEFIVQISDNGIGIQAENITKIFSYGFTTKKNGHGFGLHTSATFAQEMTGSLTASSDGLNQGATFTLILPIKAASKRDYTDEPTFEIDQIGD